MARSRPALPSWNKLVLSAPRGKSSRCQDSRDTGTTATISAPADAGSSASGASTARATVRPSSVNTAAHGAASVGSARASVTIRLVMDRVGALL